MQIPHGSVRNFTDSESEAPLYGAQVTQATPSDSYQPSTLYIQSSGNSYN